MYKHKDKIVTFIDPKEIESQALAQIETLSTLPFIYNHVAVMPDCHAGKGSCVGTVIATKGAIIPAAVGVDIGCGVIGVKTNLTSHSLPENLSDLRTAIERAIPLGAGGLNQRISKSATERIEHLEGIVNNRASGLNQDYITHHNKNWRGQLGSLGSGNHFIEVCLDEKDHLWVVLHSGSRGIGNQLASSHIKVAQRLMELYHISLEDKDLSYLAQGTNEFDRYIEDMLWAQDYALLNREEMMDRVMDEFNSFLGVEIKQEERINCHHNFTQMENHLGHNVWVTRKGAIQMRKEQLGIIPGSMGTETFVVSGLGERLSFNSAPHGAGRRFSRNEAKRRFSLNDLKEQMGNIEYRHSETLIDEIPGAYKDIRQVMEYSKELVEIKHTLNQILNVKGN